MINPFEFYDETYKWITPLIVQGVDIFRYLISNYGTVIDIKNNKQVSATVTAGYFSVHLHTINGIKKCLLHRLVAMAFVDGSWDLQVNHIDGFKNNNYYKNLEFVTARENLMHALDLGLNHRCEDKPNSKLTNNQVEEICKLLEGGFNYDDIIDKLELQNIPNINRILADIKRGKTYLTISKNYNIPVEKVRTNPKKYSLEQAEIICKAITENPEISNSELYELAGLACSTKEERKRSRGLIDSIKEGKSYKYILNKYKCNSKRFND